MNLQNRMINHQSMKLVIIYKKIHHSTIVLWYILQICTLVIDCTHPNPRFSVSRSSFQVGQNWPINA